MPLDIKKKCSSADKLCLLKKQAEELLKSDRKPELAALPTDIQDIVQELQTHQIELELQNEELRKTQEALIRSHKKFSDLYDFAPVGYLTISDKGLILEANLTAAKLLGIERGILLNQLFSNYIIKDAQDVYYRCRKKLLHTFEPQSAELTMQAKDGNLLHVQLKLTLNTDVDGNSGQFRIVMADLSQLKKLNNLLQMEIVENQMNQEKLIEAKDMAISANKAKSNFLTNMSHELRTPLNAIIGFSQLFDFIPDLQPSLKQNAKEIHKAGSHLLELINDILDLTGIESGKINLNLQSIPLIDLFEDCTATILQIAQQQNIKVLVNHVDIQQELPACDCVVFADYTKLKQVLLNLLSNAIKYNHPGGSVDLFCETTNKDNISIFVKDTGIGIPVKLQSALFEPFNRLGNEGTAIQGTGIGLTIVKKLLDTMKGSIQVVSSEHQGSTFKLVLPKIVLNKKPY